MENVTWQGLLNSLGVVIVGLIGAWSAYQMKRHKAKQEADLAEMNRRTAECNDVVSHWRGCTDDLRNEVRYLRAVLRGQMQMKEGGSPDGGHSPPKSD